MFDFFSEEDVDITEVEMDSLQKGAEDPVDDYFDRDYDSEAGDEKTEGQLIREKLDPVKATESFLRRAIGLSAEDLDTIEEEVTEEGEEIIEAQENGTGFDDSEIEDDDDEDSIDGETISEDPDEDIEDGDEGDEIDDVDDGAEQTEGDELASEALRHIWSLEDETDGEMNGGSEDDSDLELDIKYGGKSKNISINGDSVSIGGGGSDDSTTSEYDSSDSSSYDDDDDDDEDDEDGGNDDDGDDDDSSNDKSGESFLFDTDSWLN